MVGWQECGTCQGKWLPCWRGCRLTDVTLSVRAPHWGLGNYSTDESALSLHLDPAERKKREKKNPWTGQGRKGNRSHRAGTAQSHHTRRLPWSPPRPKRVSQHGHQGIRMALIPCITQSKQPMCLGERRFTQPCCPGSNPRILPPTRLRKLGLLENLPEPVK